MITPSCLVTTAALRPSLSSPLALPFPWNNLMNYTDPFTDIITKRKTVVDGT